MNSAPSQAPRSPSTTNNAANQSQAMREPKAESARKQAEVRSARERFSAKIEQNAGKGAPTSEKADAASEAQRERGVVQRQKDDGSGHTGHQGGDTGSDQGAVQVFATLLGQGVSGVATAVEASAARVLESSHFDRMAAQIAESWPSTGPQQVSIAFPQSALARSASLLREANGSISIRIAGLDPKLSALHSAQLHLQLTTALARRRLKVHSLNFESADQPRELREMPSALGSASAIPRVV